MDGNVVTADLKAGGVRDSFDAATGETARAASPRFAVPARDAGHAEYLVLEAAAARVANRRAKGFLRMYSEHYPCPSCRDAMQQFLRAYPRMSIELGYSRGEPEEFAPDPVNPRIELTLVEA
ncbi:deaminase domain-containing protein [Actinomadura monticuli]|uniref:Deaminase domain-containing protein n=1 Tax=Actinomadura monticuli TaxID=3097367 RepID=A0ABV4Q5R5_9ACTN